MLRIGLFLLTNLAILIIAGITLNLIGVNSILAANGSDLNVQNLLIFCAVFGFVGSFFSLFISKPMAKWSMKVRIIDQPRSQGEQWLLQTVKRQSEKAGIGMPEVGVFPSAQSNAFATGWNKNNALVAISEGMLQRFQADEVEAVLGHEIGHVANGDMVTLSLIQGVVNTFVMFFARLIGFFVDRVILKNQEGLGLGYFITTIVAEIFLAFLASAVVMWFSRRREFRADEAGAYLGSSQGMINALQRLRAEQGLPSDLPETMTAFGINGGLGTGIKKLFMSHPPLDERIQALRNQQAGIQR